MSERPTADSDAPISRREWVIYLGILAGNLAAVLIVTGSFMGALVATAGATLSATHVAAMARRRTPRVTLPASTEGGAQ